MLVLRLLRLHSIRRFEVFFCISDELRIAWMIDRFNSNDDIHQIGNVVVNVVDGLGFCVCWSCNKNRTSVCDRVGGCLKIIAVL